MAFSLLYVTFPDEQVAQQICNRAVEARLAACANVWPMWSCYWWGGTITSDGECVGLLKTTDSVWPQLEEALVKWHPYEVPCVMRVQVAANTAYEAWIEQEVSSSGQKPQL